MFLLFGAFIVLCGLTHAMDVLVTYYPIYWLAGLVKVVTAFVSLTTAFALFPITPKLLAMKTPVELEQAVILRTAELAAAESRLRSIVDHVVDGIITIDASGKILTFNAAAEKLFGYAAAEAIGNNVNLLMPDPYYSLHDAYIKDGSGKIIGTTGREVVGRRKDGSTFPMDLAVSEFTLEGSRCFTGIVRDITERKYAESIIREREEHLRLFFENGVFGAGEVDMKTNKIIKVNSRYCEITGYSEEELLGMSPFDYTHPDDRAADLAKFEKISNGEATHYENIKRYIRKDGQIVWVQAGARPVTDSKGTVVRTAGVVTDITPQKLAEQRAEQVSEQLKLIVDAIPALISYISPEGKYTFCNRAYADWFGQGNVEGQHMRDVLGEDAWRIVGPKIQQAFAGEEVEYEAVVNYKTGGVKWIQCCYRPHTVNGAIVGVVVLVNDITQQKREEERLTQEAQRKDEFLAMLAHELRNPLAPISNSVAVMNKYQEKMDPILLRCRGMIERQVEHMSRLVDDLLDVSRLLRGKVELQLQLCELNHVVHAAIDNVQELIAAKRHRFEMDLPQEPKFIYADPVRLTQILVNLLQNAAKYTPEEGEITLEMSCCKHNILTLKIKDTGMGIDPKLMPVIFEPFTQGDRSPARTEGGLGVGLTLVKKLAELHGGSVEAHSEGPQRGSLFVVHVPVKERDK